MQPLQTRTEFGYIIYKRSSNVEQAFVKEIVLKMFICREERLS